MEEAIKALDVDDLLASAHYSYSREETAFYKDLLIAYGAQDSLFWDDTETLRLWKENEVDGYFQEIKNSVTEVDIGLDHWVDHLFDKVFEGELESNYCTVDVIKAQLFLKCCSIVQRGKLLQLESEVKKNQPVVQGFFSRVVQIPSGKMGFESMVEQSTTSQLVQSTLINSPSKGGKEETSPGIPSNKKEVDSSSSGTLKENIIEEKNKELLPDMILASNVRMKSVRRGETSSDEGQSAASSDPRERKTHQSPTTPSRSLRPKPILKQRSTRGRDESEMPESRHVSKSRGKSVKFNKNLTETKPKKPEKKPERKLNHSLKEEDHRSYDSHSRKSENSVPSKGRKTPRKTRESNQEDSPEASMKISGYMSLPNIAIPKTYPIKPPVKPKLRRPFLANENEEEQTRFLKEIALYIRQEKGAISLNVNYEMLRKIVDSPHFDKAVKETVDSLRMCGFLVPDRELEVFRRLSSPRSRRGSPGMRADQAPRTRGPLC